MTDPSQYFKGRTVQEQMNEVIGYVDVRSAEVATTAIASDVAQVHQDMLDADADAQAAAASAAAAAGTLANAVKKTGEASQSIAGDIAVAGTLSGGVVTGTQVTVPTPVNNTDAANKKYVSDSLDGYATMVRTANAQIVGGIKTFTDNMTMGVNRVNIATPDNWKRIFTTPKRPGGITRVWLFAYAGIGTATTYAGLLQVSVAGSSEVPTATWLVKGSAIPEQSIACTIYNNVLNIWTSKSSSLTCIGYATRAAGEGAQLTSVDEADEYASPQADQGTTVKYAAVVS